jgi:demethylmenaquinone methyltransferase/2-methoxy-6-polyprenyl-1,4-benzoquinol methylase
MPFDHFNLIAGFYDRGGQFRVSEFLLGLLALSTNCFLLDAGGGTGRAAAALHSMVKDVFVADPARGMLRRAAGKGLATVCAPAESLPFPSGSFERIIMVDALHHVIDQGQTACELFRILAPGGRIVIIEPDIRKPIVRFIAIGEKVLLMRSHFLTCEKITALFSDLEAKIGVYYEGFNVILIAEKVGKL